MDCILIPNDAGRVSGQVIGSSKDIQLSDKPIAACDQLKSVRGFC